MPPSAEFLAQHAALTRAAGLATLAGRTLLEIRGADRISFLHAFCTNNIKALAAGAGCEAFVTSPQGKTLGHVLVFCEAERVLLDASPGHAAALITHFDRYLLSEDVQFVDRTSETGLLLVAGFGAAGALRQAVGHEPPNAMLTIAAAQIADVAVRVACIPFVSTGYFVWHPASEATRVIPALVASGALPCESGAVEAARIEAGFPLFGTDITVDNLPQEVGRDAQAISFTKGCYLGQETIARIDALGHVNRKLVGLKFPTGELPAAGTSLLVGEKEVGRVTSAAWSPLLNAPLALGYVRSAHSRPGNQLTSSIGAAEVVRLPITS
jgi:folate-binding protein YgfZ